MWWARASRRTVLSVLFLAGFLLPAAGARAESDPKAVEIAEAMMKAMGGREDLDAQQVMVFRFTVMRGEEELSSWYHVWNRFDGRYRLEGKTQKGEPLRVLFDLDTKEGEVWVGDEQLPAEEAASYLEYAYGRHINDTYWFLMPWKWLDPGVHLSYQGEKTFDGEVYDIVHLVFDNGTGLTSGDQYWGYVSREDHLMKRWDYLLQNEDGSPGTGDRTTYLWKDWTETGGDKLLFSRTKQRVGDDRNISIVYPELEVYREAKDDLFSPPPPSASR